MRGLRSGAKVWKCRELMVRMRAALERRAACKWSRSRLPKHRAPPRDVLPAEPSLQSGPTNRSTFSQALFAHGPHRVGGVELTDARAKHEQTTPFFQDP